MSKATLQTLLQQNRDRLLAIDQLEDIISRRYQRNGTTTTLESSLKVEEELYELDVKAIKTLRDDIKI